LHLSRRDVYYYERFIIYATYNCPLMSRIP
jgi:hypothetical protein